MAEPEDTHEEHLAWCKQRALAYLDQGDLVNALASMTSDMSKHSSTNNDSTTFMLGTLGVKAVIDGDARELRRVIEGFR